MKLLLYSEYFYPIPGGTQSFVRQLGRGLVEREGALAGRESNPVTLITQTPNNSEENAAEADGSESFPIVRRPGLRRLFQFIRRTDRMHIAGPALSPMALGFLSRKPYFVEHHGCQVACPNGLLFYEPEQSPCPGHYMAGRYGKCLECNRETVGFLRSLRMLALTPVRRWLSNRAAANIMPTDWLAGVLKLNRMTTIHHGVANALRPASKAASVTTFAFQGRLVTSKGIATLLEAAAALQKEGRPFRLKIVGDGPEMESLRARAADTGARIEFLGHVRDERLDEVFSDVAAVVMPSLGGEVFGLVAAENMLRGKLVIVSDLGALQEVVGDAGLIYPAGDAAALAACMRRVLDEPDLATSLGSAARARAQQLFSVECMMDAHIALYRKSSA